MAKRQKHIDNSFSSYLNYFKGLLSRKEKHLLEKQMMQDKFAEEAYEGMSSINADDLESDIAELHQQISGRTKEKKGRVITLLKYAAAIVLIFAVGSITVLVKKSGFEKSELAEQAELVDSSEVIHAFKAEIPDTLKPKIAQTIKKEEKKTAKIKIKRKKPVTIKEESSVSFEVADADEYLSENRTLELAFAAEESEAFEIADNELSIVPDIAMTSKANKEISLSTASAKQKESGTIIISGRVTDAGMEDPLPGVSVFIRGTSNGVITDINGNYSIEVPAEGKSTLEFAYIGYINEDVEIKDKKDISVALLEDIVALEEVVVTGYGTQKRSNMTGSVSRIESNDENPAQTIPPKPLGGMSKFKLYIKQNIRYNNLPDFDKNHIVKLEFTVSSTGEISNIHALKSPGKEFEKEAIRLLKEGPDWQAGTVDGMPSGNKVTLRIKFTPPE